MAAANPRWSATTVPLADQLAEADCPLPETVFRAETRRAVPAASAGSVLPRSGAHQTQCLRAGERPTRRPRGRPTPLSHRPFQPRRAAHPRTDPRARCRALLPALPTQRHARRGRRCRPRRSSTALTTASSPGSVPSPIAPTRHCLPRRPRPAAAVVAGALRPGVPAAPPRPPSSASAPFKDSARCRKSARRRKRCWSLSTSAAAWTWTSWPTCSIAHRPSFFPTSKAPSSSIPRPSAGRLRTSISPATCATSWPSPKQRHWWMPVQGNVEALRQVQPADLNATEIDARLGSTWIPAEDVQQFAEDVLGEEDINVSHAPGTRIVGGARRLWRPVQCREHDGVGHGPPQCPRTHRRRPESARALPSMTTTRTPTAT
jgi:hypothetical protein